MEKLPPISIILLQKELIPSVTIVGITARTEYAERILLTILLKHVEDAEKSYKAHLIPNEKVELPLNKDEIMAYVTLIFLNKEEQNNFRENFRGMPY